MFQSFHVSQKSNKKILALALDILETQISKQKQDSQNVTRQNAIVFDIDGTAIYNNISGGHRQNGNLFSLYQYALKNNVCIFFLTARPDSFENREFTVNDLKKSGYIEKSKTEDGYVQLIMRPESDITRDPFNYSVYKCARRMEINTTHNLLMSVGDTLLDMTVCVGNEYTPLNPHHAIVKNLDRNLAYVLVLQNAVPRINIKLKEEKK
jgi:predicted secreted acid phosphatase